MEIPILSSYRHNGQGEMSGLITPHILYQSFGETNDQKQSTYRELFRYELEPDKIDQIRKATNGNFALGTKRFQDEIRYNSGDTLYNSGDTLHNFQ